MHSLTPNAVRLFGLVELDSAGKVLHASADNNSARASAEWLIGHDFYSQVPELQNSFELRRRFNLFVSSGEKVERFQFDCQFNEIVVPCRVLLVRMQKNLEHAPGHTFLMQIERG